MVRPKTKAIDHKTKANTPPVSLQGLTFQGHTNASSFKARSRQNFKKMALRPDQEDRGLRSLLDGGFVFSSVICCD